MKSDYFMCSFPCLQHTVPLGATMEIVQMAAGVMAMLTVMMAVMKKIAVPILKQSKIHIPSYSGVYTDPLTAFNIQLGNRT